MLARILTGITRVPEHILEDGLLETAPVSLKSCRGSLSDDLHRGQSILSDGAAGREYANAVWRRQESVSSSSSARPTTKAPLRKDTTHRMCGLATSSRTIRDCSETKLFDHDEFIQSPKNDRSCPRLIQIAWARSPSRIAASISGCASVPIVGLTPSFKPTCQTKSEFLVTIILTLWNSNGFWYSSVYYCFPKGSLQFCQVYLRYHQVIPCNVIFEIDDSAIIEIDSPARTWTKQTYRKQDGHFAVAFGQDWICLIKPDQTMRVDGVWVEFFTYTRRGTGEYMHLSYNAWVSQKQLGDWLLFTL